ncbi:MAG: GatB/YqeY domain-containing protein [Candidatus Yanofskybacteria bacterium]|nr:GatB/YqeY domain-containing protein [Candidatus Yanofskybacteria bacterium]
MIKEKLQSDVKEALKAGNAVKRMVLGSVLSAVKGRELDKRGRLSKTESDPIKLEELSKLNDEEIVEVLSSEIKKRKEAMDLYEKGGRPELVAKEGDELNILMEYMPEQMSEDAVREEVKKAVASTGAVGVKDMGKVIGVVMAKIKGRADGQLVSRLVKEELLK